MSRLEMNYEGHGFTVRVELDETRFRVRKTSKISNVTSLFGTAVDAAECFARWVRLIEVPQ